MAFDRNDPAQVLALFNEWNLDPAAVGYAASNNTNQLLNLTNDAANNPGNDTQSRPFDASAVMDAYDPADLQANQINPGAESYTALLVSYGTGFVPDISAYETRFRALFSGIPGSVTIANLNAQTVDLSRADVLWGYETNITRDDYAAVIAAHGSPF